MISCSHSLIKLLRVDRRTDGSLKSAGGQQREGEGEGDTLQAGHKFYLSEGMTGGAVLRHLSPAPCQGDSMLIWCGKLIPGYGSEATVCASPHLCRKENE